jgi:ATP-binding cassette subfamily F protein uup
MKNKTPLLSLQDFSLAYTRENLINPFSINIFEKQRYCLVGQNGCGKSSLLKALNGNEDNTRGKMISRSGIKISYLPQSEDFSVNISAIDFILKNKSEEVLNSKSYEANIFLDIFKINPSTIVSELSGGNQRRLSLIKALMSEADLLLLDEPTNHLDVTTIEWLEDYINKLPSAVIVISHDRQFLKNTTNHTIWIDRGRVFVNSSGYKSYEEWSGQIIEEEIVHLQKLTKEVEKENLWRQQGVTARRKRNQQRLRNLFSLRDKLAQSSANVKNRLARISLGDLEPLQASKIAVDLDNVSYGYNGSMQPIIKELSLRIIAGDKIGVIGANGSGKSTLIKLITGENKPTSGKIYQGPKTTISYFEQDRKTLDMSKTSWEVMCPEGGDHLTVGGNARHVVSYLKDFMFTPEQIKTVTALLSGGQQNRLLLAKALANPGNFLILDEPTNDLDSDTLDILLEILSDYKGTVIVVSHDRDFLEKLVSRTVIFEDGRIIENFGGYLDYKKNTANKLAQVSKVKVPTKQNIEAEKSNGYFSYKFRVELEKLEVLIPELQDKIVAIELQLQDNNLYNDSPEKFLKLSTSLNDYKNKLEQAEDRWLELELIKSSVADN